MIDIFLKLELHLILYESEIGERRASWQGHFLWIYLNFLTTRFANWMNESDSDFNSLWIDRICLQCSLTRNCEIEKNCETSLPTYPTYGVSWQLRFSIAPKFLSRILKTFNSVSREKSVCQHTPQNFCQLTPQGAFRTNKLITK